MSNIRILIADDHALIREGLKTVLSMEPGITVAGMAGSGQEACALAGSCKPDVMLLDIRMPGLDGVACISHIKAVSPETKILMLTTFHLEEYVTGALANGASGFLLKDIPMNDLLEAIRDAAAGKIVLPPEVAATLSGYLKHKSAGDTGEPACIASLSVREREAAHMLSQGFTNHQIASALFLSEGTVRNIISAIYAKTGINDRAQAALFLKEHLL
jgi:DNA-binding NarL/FixJ family response regulator